MGGEGRVSCKERDEVPSIPVCLRCRVGDIVISDPMLHTFCGGEFIPHSCEDEGGLEGVSRENSPAHICIWGVEVFESPLFYFFNTP